MKSFEVTHWLVTEAGERLYPTEGYITLDNVGGSLSIRFTPEVVPAERIDVEHPVVRVEVTVRAGGNALIVIPLPHLLAPGDHFVFPEWSLIET